MPIDTLILPNSTSQLYRITLDSVVCDQIAELQTWTYTVTKLGGQDISNWVLRLCEDLQVKSSSPGGAEIGKPGGGKGNCLNGQNGCLEVSKQIKWNTSGGTFSFTVRGCCQCQKVQTAIKAGEACFCGNIIGPCCPSNPSPCSDCGGTPKTTISATVSVNAEYTESATWTIAKTVSPNMWNFTPTQSGVSQYTITVTKGTTGTTGTISGQICVKNEGAVATQGLAIKFDLEVGTGSGFTMLLSNQPVDVSGNPFIPGGQEVCYNYSVNLSGAQIQPGATYTVTAHVTITNATGNPETTASGIVIFPLQPTVITFDKVVVRDPQFEINQEIDKSAIQTTISKEKTFTCNNQGDNLNTATLYGVNSDGTETEIDSASATVTVTCNPQPPSRGILFI